jgi:hypothetical protein
MIKQMLLLEDLEIGVKAMTKMIGNNTNSKLSYYLRASTLVYLHLYKFKMKNILCKNGFKRHKKEMLYV